MAENMNGLLILVAPLSSLQKAFTQSEVFTDTDYKCLEENVVQTVENLQASKGHSLK